MSAIKQEMKMKLRMEGAVNGHKFMIEGEGKGKPFDGTQTMDLTVKEGGPLPFAYHILTTVFDYGNRAFVKYPTDIVDCFKQTFPEGFSWERVMTYEDGGTCVATNDITIMKDADDCFVYDIRFDGVNFPANGPVMQNKTVQWEPCTEIIYVRDEVLTGHLNMALLLQGGGHYRSHLKTTYKPKKAVQLPQYHFVNHRLQILSHDVTYNNVKLYEHAEAHSGLPKLTK